jgi:Isochorismatase family
MFTKGVRQNEVVHSIDDSLLLVLNPKNFSGSKFADTVKKIEALAERLTVAVDFFDFIVGDLDKMNEIFECLKRRQSEGEKRTDREIRPTSLFISGAYLEDQISICALNALAVGYDVYLLNDATAPRDVTHRETFIARLTQAGVVLSTVQQMLYQWLAVETDQDRKDALRKLLGYPNSI